MNYEEAKKHRRAKFYLERRLNGGIVSTMAVVYENYCNFNIAAFPGWSVVKSELIQ